MSEMPFFTLRQFQIHLMLQCKFFKAAEAELLNALTILQSKPVDPEVRIKAWGAIQAMLTAAANISKALWGQSGRNLETWRKPVRDSLGTADDSRIREYDLRNHFDHFDERIDRWVKNKPHIHDLGIDDLSTDLSEDTRLWRSFDSKTMSVIFEDDRFEIRPATAEVDKLLSAIEREFAKPNWFAIREHDQRP